MLDFFSKSLSKLFGNKSDRDLKTIQPIVAEIHAAYTKVNAGSADDLRAASAALRQRLSAAISGPEAEIARLRTEAEALDTDLEGKERVYAEIDRLRKEVQTLLKAELDAILPEAFAIMKDTARRFKEGHVQVRANDRDRALAATADYVRLEGESAVYANSWMAAGNTITWDMVHYDVQLIGGIVLHQGKISEMATGEGKTLVATLPVFLNALSGKGVHLVTVNNYLSRRDAEWMGPLMEFHGLRVDCIDKHEPNSVERRNAYLADITYGTNNEFGFDYLRDNMARNPEDLVQREHQFAIVDEVDSVLIDDARTPLIISGPAPRGDDHEFFELKPKIEKLVNAQRNYINTVLADSKKQLANSTDKKAQEEGGFLLLRAHRGLPKNKALIKFLSEPGMRALLQKTEAFYQQDHGKEMVKVDAELFFVIDERHNTIELTERGIDLISTSSDDAKFYVLPDVGAEMVEVERSALAQEEKLQRKDQIMRDYTIKSERVHTMNQLLKAYTLFEIDVDYVVMENKVKIVDEQTGRILDGRRYSDGLHQAIEAKENVKVEAATQTYATVTLQNYFRMYHKLAGMTGTAETEASEFWDIYKLDVVVIPTNRSISRNDQEDLVYKTKREKYNAVIDQIIAETEKGRPVLVGTTSVEISELLSRMLKLKNIKHNVLNAKLHQREAEIVASAGLTGTVTIATNMAGRGTDIKLGPGVKEAGGLAIIGTERHDSRRVDRQLRGRAGRQGDPGSSQFFVSLEDDLMRLFGSDRIAGLMDRMGLKEGEVIQHSMITRSIERAQKKVEENNFATRKRLLEYDDVMNSQREVVYTRRRHALHGERLSLDVSNTYYDVCEGLVTEYQEQKNPEGFELELIRLLSIESPLSREEFSRMPASEAAQRVFDAAMQHYAQKSRTLAQAALPAMQNVFEHQAHVYENIVFPITDGLKTLHVVVNLKRSVQSQGMELANGIERNVVLNIIDDEWKEHLREMDELKQSVQNAVYEQKDPLLIYKFESFNLFKDMVQRVNREMVSFLSRAFLPMEQEPQVREAKPAPKADLSQIKTSRSEQVSSTPVPQFSGGGPEYEQTQERPKQMPVRAEKTVGRNDPCPCGSGKKFKACHGQNA